MLFLFCFVTGQVCAAGRSPVTGGSPVRRRKAAPLDLEAAGEANLIFVIVCHCNVVTDGDIAAALDDGARTVAQICRRTGAAQQCGSCVFSVRQAVCDHVSRGIPQREEIVSAAS
jgi:bacterioferritin-associated ferredoxin